MPATERVAAPAGATCAICAHCGLVLSGAGVVAGPALPPSRGDLAFCCAGCRAAFEIIHDSGLGRFYDLAERRSGPVQPAGRTFAEFDDPTFRDLYVRARADALEETELYLEGVQCVSCVWLLERMPFVLPGTASAELEAPRSLLRIVWDPTRTSLSRIATTLDALGYRPHPFRGLRAERARRDEDRAALVRIGVSGAIAGNVMMLAIATYAGWFGGMERAYEQTFRWASLVLTVPAVFGPGRVFFRSAWASIRTRALHMDVPIALAIAVGFARGAWNTIVGRGPIYFDGVAALIFLLLVGRFLQQRAQRAAHDSAELVRALAPRTARVLDRATGEVREQPAEALVPGMSIEVRGGESIPADGTVTEGRSEIDRALLSGESRPVAVGPGDPIHAGTLNCGGRIVALVERAGEESRLGRMVREVARAAERRAPIVRLADRLAGGFVAIVLALAALTFAIWVRRDAGAALDHAIAMLVVTCPCALALATPLAVSSAIGRAARAGILIKGGDALERLARPSLVVLDKTGTVTEGRLALVEDRTPPWVRPLVVALEREARHPIATAFVEAWGGGDLPHPPLRVRSVEVVFGGGIEGWVGRSRVRVGSPAYVAAGLCGPVPDGEPESNLLLTTVWIAVDGALAGRVGFGDRVRSGTPEALAALRRQGHDLRMLSGDDPALVRAVGAELGFATDRIEGGATPEAKLARVDLLERERSVVMVGDGVNDAAAIARASVGVGVRGGAEACLQVADVFLTRPGLAPLVALFEGAGRTMRVIRRNILFSLAYNAVGATLALAGLMDPLLAALLMPASSLTVVLLSWKSRTFEAAP